MTPPPPPPPETPAARHFDLCMVAALARVLDGVAAMVGGGREAHAQFPFLGQLEATIARSRGKAGSPDDALRAFEATHKDHLPLRALCDDLGLDARARSLVLAVGLAEEDPRFAALFDKLQETEELGRPTVGTLVRWWSRDWPELRALVNRLVAAGLVDLARPELPTSLQALRVHPVVWSALRGEAPVDGALTLRPREALPSLDALVLSAEERANVNAFIPLLRRAGARSLLVRGHRANGRRTLLGAVARELGRGALDLDAAALRADDPAWRVAGVLATALQAMPVIHVAPGPGERVTLPALPGYRGPVGVALGAEGAVEGPLADAALTLARAVPDLEARRALWRLALPLDGGAVDELATRYRLTSGVIHRVAAHARLLAAARTPREKAEKAPPPPPPPPTLADVTRAYSEAPRDALELLTSRVPVQGDWKSISVAPDTLHELETLERWCRQRERLRARGGPALKASLQPGVRALFQGASGTGKTLAARTLASVLQKDLYRVELAAVVNKYIGETEKNLQAVFSRAEAMDVVLLLDEGDALMGRRTAVQSSNDRYANLETNYLLQRVESFEGILVVTTNAADHIDTAFARRMDVVVDFRAPEAAERASLWALHLPEGNAVSDGFLREVVDRCALSGGQVRNVALHATLLSLDGDGVARDRHLEEALLREYRRAGALCPLARSADA